jgi:hypothetical protein
MRAKQNMKKGEWSKCRKRNTKPKKTLNPKPKKSAKKMNGFKGLGFRV